MAGTRITQLMPYALPGRAYGSFAGKAKAPAAAVAEAAAAAVTAGAPYIPRPVIYVEFALAQWPKPFVSAHEIVTHHERTVRIKPLRPRILVYDSHAQAVHVENIQALVTCGESISMAEFMGTRFQGLCETREEVRLGLFHLMMVEMDDTMLGLR